MSNGDAVVIKGLEVRFRRQTVLPGLNLSVPGGQIVGILGPSGSGKTTLVRSIMGLVPLQAGTISVFGRPVPSFDALKQIGYMAQNDALYDDLTAADHLTFFGRVAGLGPAAARARAVELLDFVGLSGEKKKAVRFFSGGMRRRLSLAVALVGRPPLLILDEPTVGIDPVLRQKFWNEFAALKAGGCTILTTTHVMDEAARCDHLVLLREGRIIADGTQRELLLQANEPNLEAAFLRFSGAAEKEGA